MTIWIDAQLSPFIALWINNNFPGIDAKSVRSLSLKEASDKQIFDRAKQENVIVMSKDYDFFKLIELYGTPPKLIWITCGNTSNSRMCEILSKTLTKAIELLISGESIVEIQG